LIEESRHEEESHRDAAAAGLQPTKVVTYAGAAHRSSRRTARRVNRRHNY
jgi:hypothetical protein